MKRVTIAIEADIVERSDGIVVSGGLHHEHMSFPDGELDMTVFSGAGLGNPYIGVYGYRNDACDGIRIDMRTLAKVLHDAAKDHIAKKAGAA